jgi:hypothetical protein
MATAGSSKESGYKGHTMKPVRASVNDETSTCDRETDITLQAGNALWLFPFAWT